MMGAMEKENPACEGGACDGLQSTHNLHFDPALFKRLFDGNDVDPGAFPERYRDLVKEALRLNGKARQDLIRAAAKDDPELMRMLADTAPAAAFDIKNAAAWIPSDYPPPEQILTDCFDRGTKVAVIGNSKARKSFFLLQFAVTIASGCGRFLQWDVPKPRRVLMVQLEIHEGHYHKRLVRMAEGLAVQPGQLDGLDVLNSRGYANVLQDPGFCDMVINGGYDVVIVDPLYKVLNGDENAANDVKPTLALFDRICEDTGATLVFAHHNPKGYAGDRQTIDRGAGSSVLARDFDAALYITDHRDDDLSVLETVVRCYPPREPFCIRWDDGHFVTDATPPVVKTSGNANTRPKVTEAQVMETTRGGPMAKGAFMVKLQELGTRRSADAIVKQMLHAGKLDITRQRGRNGCKLIGTPEQIQQLEEQHATN